MKRAFNVAITFLLVSFLQTSSAVAQGQSYNEIDDRLVAAAALGDLKKVKRLIDEGASINHRGYGATALIAAASNKKSRVVKFLLDLGVENIDEQGGHTSNGVSSSPLNNEKPFAKRKTILVNGGPETEVIDDYIHSIYFISTTALISAVIREDVESTRLLVDAGADLEKSVQSRFNKYLQGERLSALKKSYGTTALTWAILLKNVELTSILLSAGADINAKSALGEVCIDLAIRMNEPKIIELVVEKAVKNQGSDNSYFEKQYGDMRIEKKCSDISEKEAGALKMSVHDHTGMKKRNGDVSLRLVYRGVEDVVVDNKNFCIGYGINELQKAQ